MLCPLCRAPAAPLRLARSPIAGREYGHCPRCDLRFVPAAFHVASDEERRRYETHNNDVQDPRYRAYLSPVFEALRPRLSPKARGLDFGAGPGPCLAKIFEEAGFEMALYDKHFHPDPIVLEATYDFLVCTETVEHLADPGEVFGSFARWVKPGGWIAVKTERLEDWSKFGEWYYPRDPTHIAFYSPRSMAWIAAAFGWLREEITPDLTLFHRLNNLGPY